SGCVAAIRTLSATGVRRSSVDGAHRHAADDIVHCRARAVWRSSHPPAGTVWYSACGDLPAGQPGIRVLAKDQSRFEANVNRREDVPASLPAEVVGWLAFVLFVGAVWKVRQTLDRWHREL